MSCLAALCGLRLRFPVLLSSSWCCSSLGCLSGGCCRCGTSPQSHIPLYMVVGIFSEVGTLCFSAMSFVCPENGGETHFDFFHFAPEFTLGKTRFFPCRGSCETAFQASQHLATVIVVRVVENAFLGFTRQNRIRGLRCQVLVIADESGTASGVIFSLASSMRMADCLVDFPDVLGGKGL